MLLKILGALAVGATLLGRASAELIPSVRSWATNVLATGDSGPVRIDQYVFRLENTSPMPVTAIELEFQGAFWVIPGVNSVFRDSIYLPEIDPGPIADSFFVANGSHLVIESTETASVHSASWSYPNNEPPVAPASGYADLALFSVPTGTDVAFVSGRAEMDGSYIDLVTDRLVANILGSGHLGAELRKAINQSAGDRVVLPSVLRLSNGDEERTLGDLGDITASLRLEYDAMTIEPAAKLLQQGDGIFDLELTADWSALPTGETISGSLRIDSELGIPSRYHESFSFAVPEPAARSVLSLALIGLAGAHFRSKE